MNALNRGQVAQAAQVNIETLRYYEKRGLIPAPARSHSNYRRYPREAVDQVRFVKHAQELGFSLEEIKELLSLRATQGTKAAQVKHRAERKIAEIAERIDALRRMQTVLHRLVAACSGEGPATECTILHSIEHGGSTQ